MSKTLRVRPVVCALALTVSACSYEKSSPTQPASPLAEAPSPTAPAGPSSNRTPDPDEGQRLPLPDMSSVVAQIASQHWGAGQDEHSTEVYIVDVITGHGGDNPSPGWGDVTDVTRHNGTIGAGQGGRF